MTETTKKGRKDPLDRCYTPEVAVVPLVTEFWRRGILNVGTRVIEPYAGQHQAITRMLRKYGASVVTNDLDPGADTDLHYDWSETIANPVGHWSVCVSNPPYHRDLFATFVEAAIKCADHTALLLPLRFLEPTKKRRAFLREYCPQGLIVVPRVEFLFPSDEGCKPYGGVDNAQYAWMIWSDKFKENMVYCPENV